MDNQSNLTRLQACRVCLESDSKLYDMNEQNLGLHYEELIQLNINTDHRLPQALCWECAKRMCDFKKFKTKALRCHNLMMDMLALNGEFVLNRLTDRYANGIASSLARTSMLAIDSFEPPSEDDKFIINQIEKIPDSNAIFIDDKKVKQETDSDVDNGIHEVTITVKNEDMSFVNENENDMTQDSFNDDENNEEQDFEDENFQDQADEDEDFTLSDSVKSEPIRKKRKVTTKKAKTKSKKTEKGKKKAIIEKPAEKVDRRIKPVHEVVNTDMFDIIALSMDEQYAEIEKRKETSNYKNSEFKCEKCFKGFRDEEAHKTHMARHSDLAGKYECDICKMRFAKRHTLLRHAISHTHKYTCKECNFVGTRRHDAKLHEQFHNGTKYQCPHCQLDFGKYTSYMSHLRIKHPSDFVCGFCGNSFVSQKGLDQHKNLKHRFDEQQIPENGPYCEKCELRFATEEALHKHFELSERHKDTPEAAEEVKRKALLKKQAEGGVKRRKYKGEPIQCERCDKQLATPHAYNSHFRLEHPGKNRTHFPSKSYKAKCMCEVCGRIFQNHTQLKDHSFAHSDTKQFECEHCGKTFQRRYRLLVHQRMHEEVRLRYPCAVCGKRFANRSNVNRHVKIHSGLKPYKCETCGKGFSNSGDRRNHFTYVHLKKPWPKRNRDKRRGDGMMGDFGMNPQHQLLLSSADLHMMPPM